MVVRCETMKNSDWTTYTRTVKKFNLLTSASLCSVVMKAKFELSKLTITIIFISFSNWLGWEIVE
jgi:hypothetical protein